MSTTGKLAGAAAALALVAAAPAASAQVSLPFQAPGGGRVEPAAPPGGPPTSRPAERWIVELDSPSLTAYEGGGKAGRATAPRATGRKLDVSSADARAWRQELDRRERAVLDRAGVSVRPLHRYRTVLNGFAAQLSDDEVARLRRTSGVRRVVRGGVLHPSQEAGIGGGKQPASPAATSEAEFLGLPKGLWRRLGGPRQAGRGVIVGVVDSGIAPEAASFAPRDLEPPAVWNGACESGERFPVTSCNGKLIGARSFLEGFDPGQLPEWVSDSPRDDVGHGTHVASIAAGNKGVDPVIAGNDLGVDEITGVAPAAHIAAYKACWPFGCAEVDVVAAIDAAVADGVDVLNLSLGRPSLPGDTLDPMELALLNADAAGVFVAVAAGNDGDRLGAIGPPATAPWVTAVAATTSPRVFRAPVRARGAGGATLEQDAASTGPGVEGELVDPAQFVENPRDWLANPRHCVSGMTPERVRDKVVLCDAWAPLGLVESTLREAGAAGFILSVPDHTDNAIVQTQLPSVLMGRSAVERLRELATDGSITVTIGAGRAATWQPDRATWFTSRGPLTTAPDLMRPDVSAPGVNVLAAYAPPPISSIPQERFAALNGTSMASPHIAGVGALLTQAHPTWSGAQMRSALVTTARPAVDSDGDGRAPHMVAGAGRVDPGAAADAELILAPTTQEYERYAEGVAPEAMPGEPEPIAPRDLNVPHLALESATASATVARTVESVARARATWVTRLESVDDTTGIIARVSPARFTLAPGQRQRLSVSVQAGEGRRTFRDLTVVVRNQQSAQEIRLPVSVRNPGIKDVPERIVVDDAAPDGSRDIDVEVAGTVSAAGHGLARPDVREVELGLVPSENRYEAMIPVEVPEGATLLSAQIPGGFPPEDFVAVRIIRDVDGDGQWLPSDPIVTDLDDPSRADIVLPEPGKYLIWVVSEERPLRTPLSTWLVVDERPDDPEPAPGLVATGDPLRAFPAERRQVSLRWTGADGEAPLRGVVVWRQGERADAGDVLGTSIVEVKPAPAH